MKKSGSGKSSTRRSPQEGKKGTASSSASSRRELSGAPGVSRDDALRDLTPDSQAYHEAVARNQAEQVKLLNEKYQQALDNTERWRQHAEHLEVELTRTRCQRRQMAQELEWWRHGEGSAEGPTYKRPRSESVNEAAVALLLAKKQGAGPRETVTEEQAVEEVEAEGHHSVALPPARLDGESSKVPPDHPQGEGEDVHHYSI